MFRNFCLFHISQFLWSERDTRLGRIFFSLSSTKINLLKSAEKKSNSFPSVSLCFSNVFLKLSLSLILCLPFSIYLHIPTYTYNYKCFWTINIFYKNTINTYYIPIPKYTFLYLWINTPFSIYLTIPICLPFSVYLPIRVPIPIFLYVLYITLSLSTSAHISFCNFLYQSLFLNLSTISFFIHLSLSTSVKPLSSIFSSSLSI